MVHAGSTQTHLRPEVEKKKEARKIICGQPLLFKVNGTSSFFFFLSISGIAVSKFTCTNEFLKKKTATNDLFLYVDELSEANRRENGERGQKNKQEAKLRLTEMKG